MKIKALCTNGKSMNIKTWPRRSKRDPQNREYLKIVNTNKYIWIRPQNQLQKYLREPVLTGCMYIIEKLI